MTILNTDKLFNGNGIAVLAIFTIGVIILFIIDNKFNLNTTKFFIGMVINIFLTGVILHLVPEWHWYYNKYTVLVDETVTINEVVRNYDVKEIKLTPDGEVICILYDKDHQIHPDKR